MLLFHTILFLCSAGPEEEEEVEGEEEEEEEKEQDEEGGFHPLSEDFISPNHFLEEYNIELSTHKENKYHLSQPCTINQSKLLLLHLLIFS